MRNSQRVRSQRWSVRFKVGGNPLVIEADFWSVKDARKHIENRIGMRLVGISKIVD